MADQAREAAIKAAMMEELGIARLDSLPMTDSHDGRRGAPHGRPVESIRRDEMRALNQPVTPQANDLSLKWKAAIESGEFQDDDAERIAGVDDLGGGRLYSLPIRAEPSAVNQMLGPIQGQQKPYQPEIDGLVAKKYRKRGQDLPPGERLEPSQRKSGKRRAHRTIHQEDTPIPELELNPMPDQSSSKTKKSTASPAAPPTKPMRASSVPKLPPTSVRVSQQRMKLPPTPLVSSRGRPSQDPPGTVFKAEIFLNLSFNAKQNATVYLSLPCPPNPSLFTLFLADVHECEWPITTWSEYIVTALDLAIMFKPGDQPLWYSFTFPSETLIHRFLTQIRSLKEGEQAPALLTPHGLTQALAMPISRGPTQAPPILASVNSPPAIPGATNNGKTQSASGTQTKKKQQPASSQKQPTASQPTTAKPQARKAANAPCGDKQTGVPGASQANPAFAGATKKQKPAKSGRQGPAFTVADEPSTSTQGPALAVKQGQKVAAPTNPSKQKPVAQSKTQPKSGSQSKKSQEMATTTTHQGSPISNLPTPTSATASVAKEKSPEETSVSSQGPSQATLTDMRSRLQNTVKNIFASLDKQGVTGSTNEEREQTANTVKRTVIATWFIGLQETSQFNNLGAEERKSILDEFQDEIFKLDALKPPAEYSIEQLLELRPLAWDPSVDLKNMHLPVAAEQQTKPKPRTPQPAANFNHKAMMTPAATKPVKQEQQPSTDKSKHATATANDTAGSALPSVGHGQLIDDTGVASEAKQIQVRPACVSDASWADLADLVFEPSQAVASSIDGGCSEKATTKDNDGNTTNPMPAKEDIKAKVEAKAASEDAVKKGVVKKGAVKKDAPVQPEQQVPIQTPTRPRLGLAASRWAE